MKGMGEGNLIKVCAVSEVPTEKCKYWFSYQWNTLSQDTLWRTHGIVAFNTRKKRDADW